MKQSEKADLFARVYTETNVQKSRRGGTLDRSDLNAILKRFKVEKKDWYYALANAKKESPNLHQLFLKSYGRTLPEKADAADLAEDNAEARPVEIAAVAAEPAAEAGVTDPGDALANILAWLKDLGTPDRRRVIGAVQAFYPV